MTSEIADIIASFGALSYFGVFGIAILSNIVIPVPEEVTLLGFGYLTGIGVFSLFPTILIIIGGLLVSDIVIYGLSRRGSAIVQKIYEKVFLKRFSQINIGEVWIDTHIKKIVFFSRFLIQFRFIGPFLAGQRKLSLKTFVFYNTLALMVYVPIYVVLGNYFHQRVAKIIEDVGTIRNIALLALGILILFFFLIGVKKIILRKVRSIFSTITK